jgi:hypothetical protein
MFQLEKGYHDMLLSPAEGVVASQGGLLFTEELQGDFCFSFCSACSKY